MSLEGKRILLVEDEVLIALDTSDELEQAGCIVTGPAFTLATAVSLAATAELDAAVLDVNLNGEQIWPAAKILGERGIPIVFLTAFSGDRQSPANFAQAPRLDKPLRPGALVQVLNSLFEK